MLSVIAQTLLAAGLVATAPQASKQVAVVTQTIPRGGAVDLSNVALRNRKDLKLRRSFRAYTWQRGESLRAKRTLRVGAPVGRHDVEPMPDVVAGDQVVVELTRGSVRVTGTAIAKEDGLAGETIWVQNPKSNRRLRVKVLEPGRVALRVAWSGGRR